jgi:hypothetical protein
LFFRLSFSPKHADQSVFFLWFFPLGFIVPPT